MRSTTAAATTAAATATTATATTATLFAILVYCERAMIRPKTEESLFTQAHAHTY